MIVDKTTLREIKKLLSGDQSGTERPRPTSPAKRVGL